MRLAFALLATALLLTPVAGGGSSPPLPREAIVVPTGAAPCGAAFRAGSGSLWVGVYETGTLLHVADERVAARIRIGPTPCRVAVGPAAVWVTLDRPGEVVRVSLGSGRRKRIRVGTGAFDVLLASGSAWATSFEVGTIAKIDPVTARVTRVFRDGANPAGLASCGGHIWVGHGRAATWLTSIDPSTHRLRRLDVGTKSPGWPRCVFGQLWVTTPKAVLKIDARSGKVLARLRLGGTPAEAAAGPDGLVWITDKERSVVHRVDPAGRTVVDSFAAGPGAFALARAGDSMWVTSFAGADVRRYER